MSEEAAKNADETKPERIILLNHYLTSGWCDPGYRSLRHGAE
jgi:hypothetical protein